MKVLHLINTLSAGGAELHLLTLCRKLKARGIDVTVACLREQVKGSRSLRPDFEAEGVSVLNFAEGRRWDRTFLVRAHGVLRSARPDILHTHLPRADFAGLAGRFVSPRPAWVSSVHNVYGEYWSGRRALPILNWVWRKPDAVIAISKAVRDWLVNDRSVPRAKTTVVYYGIDGDLLADGGSDIRSQWGLESNRVVGSLGRLEPRKGHQTLIQAMPAVVEALPDARLVIAGHDPWGYGETLRSLVRKLGLDDNVKLVGFQSDVASFFRSLDLFAFASVSEGFGQVLIEAMAAAKAVLATDVAPINEIVLDGQTGLLSEPTPESFSRATIALLEEPARLATMGQAGQEIVRSRFSAERMAEETVAIYESIARDKAS